MLGGILNFRLVLRASFCQNGCRKGMADTTQHSAGQRDFKILYSGKNDMLAVFLAVLLRRNTCESQQEMCVPLANVWKM